jgi:hypothetical protein
MTPTTAKEVYTLVKRLGGGVYEHRCAPEDEQAHVERIEQRGRLGYQPPPADEM